MQCENTNKSPPRRKIQTTKLNRSKVHQAMNVPGPRNSISCSFKPQFVSKYEYILDFSKRSGGNKTNQFKSTCPIRCFWPNIPCLKRVKCIVYNELSLFNVHVLIMYVPVYMNVNKLCSNLTAQQKQLLESSGVGKASKGIF